MIKEKLANYLNNGDWLWAKTIKIFHQDINSDDIQTTYHYYSKLVTKQSARINLYQIYGSKLNFDDVQLTGKIYEDTIILKNLANCTDIEVQIAEVLGGMKHHRAKNIPRFLLEA